jgi:hypothetical protein
MLAPQNVSLAGPSPPGPGCVRDPAPRPAPPQGRAPHRPRLAWGPPRCIQRPRARARARGAARGGGGACRLPAHTNATPHLRQVHRHTHASRPAPGRQCRQLQQAAGQSSNRTQLTPTSTFRSACTFQSHRRPSAQLPAALRQCPTSPAGRPPQQPRVLSGVHLFQRRALCLPHLHGGCKLSWRACACPFPLSRAAVRGFFACLDLPQRGSLCVGRALHFAGCRGRLALFGCLPVKLTATSRDSAVRWRAAVRPPSPRSVSLQEQRFSPIHPIPITFSGWSGQAIHLLGA